MRRRALALPPARALIQTLALNGCTAPAATVADREPAAPERGAAAGAGAMFFAPSLQVLKIPRMSLTTSATTCGQRGADGS